MENKLQRLQDQGVIEPVSFADWAAPVVPVLKQDNTVRICGNYKLTVNKEATPDIYPLHRVEDLFALLSGVSFSKLDLVHAYQQLHLDNHSKKFTTINTTRGLFQYSLLYTGNIPTHNGRSTSWNSWSMRILGRCSCDRKNNQLIISTI